MTRQRSSLINNQTYIFTLPLDQRAAAFLLDAALQAVYKKLVDWIKRCDEASKQGLPKSPLETADGGAIVPEDIDEEWWETDIARRIVQQAQLPDEEEGPVSAEEDHLRSREIVHIPSR